MPSLSKNFPISDNLLQNEFHSSLVLLKIIVGITHEVRGLENLKKDFYLISSKHQSTWETIAFWVLTEEPIYFLKRELLFIPFFQKEDQFVLHGEYSTLRPLNLQQLYNLIL